ncbi:hypothetical protein SNL152K_2024 [Streptomyces sp. NL15-2K]|nr:hypothetical protein SNL152K_2024 [Streptomyces sp. NL15-2K]
MPCGTQGGTQDQDRGVFWSVKAVLQGVRWCLAHPSEPLISHGISHGRSQPNGSCPSRDDRPGTAGPLGDPGKCSPACTRERVDNGPCRGNAGCSIECGWIPVARRDSPESLAGSPQPAA